MYTLKLRYGETLLRLLRREVSRGRVFGSVDRARVSDLCDRFERVHASLPKRPLVWEGDYA